MTLDLLAERLRYRFRCGATLASQPGDLTVDLIAHLFEPFLGFNGFRPVIFGQLRLMTFHPLAEFLRYRFRCGATLASQRCDLVVDLIAQSFEPFLNFRSYRPAILGQLCNMTFDLLAE